MESPRSAAASPHTTNLPAWAMNALMWPTLPPTTISTPFMEMPQRAPALPPTTTRPPQPVAPADMVALPVMRTTPDMMFSASPVLALPSTSTRPRWCIPAQ